MFVADTRRSCRTYSHISDNREEKDIQVLSEILTAGANNQKIEESFLRLCIVLLIPKLTTFSLTRVKKHYHK
jgi:hypothetical protein